MNGNGGIVVLIIIGIVLNMVIKGMRSRMQTPPQKRPAPRPDLGQDVDRPFADEARPQAPRTPLAPQPAPRVSDVQPVAEERDLTRGVSLEGTSLEGTSLETQSMGGTDTVTEAGSPVTVGKRTSSNPVAEWFRGNGVVRGIVMSEILNPPVSRRR